ncbi:sulfite exporter TauE/SafE family protein [Haliea salexigens]|uniref:sulfite exporter TauE/SafE family protein n=2 Tax=Haliea salexigens TaxID=287487 RepID=UPI0004061384|nr:sulfite exporter TauE/SafE family protein [Haliea salexigens]
MIIPPGLDVATTVLLLGCSTLTSLLTATLGAGGGVLLLLLLSLWLPPAIIIPVHGLIQLGSNGGRAALTWRHIDWRLLRAFAPGVALGVLAGALLLVTLPPAIWQLSIGLFVLYLCWGPPLPRAALGATGTFAAAALTSFASLFVGATGPLVAAFVKQTQTDRYRTVATFALAMVLQHAPKLLVFGTAGFIFRDWLAFALAMIAAGFAGTWLGVRLLGTVSDRRFSRLLNVVLTVLALRLLWQAVDALLGSSAGLSV